MDRVADALAQGVVRVWHEADGWGVIVSPATPGGCLVLESALDMHALDTLRVGQRVVFTWEATDHAEFTHRAVRVRP